MLIGYARVSKADGSQVLDLQRDALIAAGMAPEQIYQDEASGKREDRPGLTACLKALCAHPRAHEGGPCIGPRERTQRGTPVRFEQGPSAARSSSDAES